MKTTTNMNTNAKTHSHLAWLACLCVLPAASCFEKLDSGAVGELPCAFGSICPPPEDGAIPTLTTTPGILLADGGTTDDPCVKNAEDSRLIRAAFCVMCHQEPAHLGTPAFGFVLDDTRLTTSESSQGIPYVTRGDPAHSRLYQRVLNQEMPPPPPDVTQPRLPAPTLSDVSVIYGWIMCLGRDGGASDGGQR